MTPATLIYHITDGSNLPAILAQGGLLAFNLLRQQQLDYKSIAYESVQDRRATTRVPCVPGGVLHDYVPFYFAPRSPMLYTISMGNVPSCPNGQDNVIYLVTSAEKVRDAGLGLAFADGHGIMALSQFFNDLTHLNQVDWEVMGSKMWNDTAQHPDRKRRRQAEFLVHQLLPWDLIIGIATINQENADSVQRYITAQGLNKPVRVRRDWYY